MTKSGTGVTEEVDHVIWGTPEPITEDSSLSDFKHEGLVDGVVVWDASDSPSSSRVHSDSGHPKLDKSAPAVSSEEVCQVEEVEAPAASSIAFGEMEMLHRAGQCSPCLYANTQAGCMNGNSCRFCHLRHSRKNRPRPCKAKRKQCKQIVSMLQTCLGPESQEFEQVSKELSTQSGYMRSILTRRSAAGQELAPEEFAHMPMPSSSAQSSLDNSNLSENALEALLSAASYMSMAKTPNNYESVSVNLNRQSRR
jgi:hypothetical protein